MPVLPAFYPKYLRTGIWAAMFEGFHQPLAPEGRRCGVPLAPVLGLTSWPDSSALSNSQHGPSLGTPGMGVLLLPDPQLGNRGLPCGVLGGLAPQSRGLQTMLLGPSPPTPSCQEPPSAKLHASCNGNVQKLRP